MKTRNTLNILHAEIQFNTIYTCSKCGKQEIGDTVRQQIRSSSTDELKDVIDDLHQSSYNMPVGWSYNGVFNCGCNKE